MMLRSSTVCCGTSGSEAVIEKEILVSSGVVRVPLGPVPKGGWFGMTVRFSTVTLRVKLGAWRPSESTKVLMNVAVAPSGRVLSGVQDKVTVMGVPGVGLGMWATMPVGGRAKTLKPVMPGPLKVKVEGSGNFDRSAEGISISTKGESTSVILNVKVLVAFRGTTQLKGVTVHVGGW